MGQGFSCSPPLTPPAPWSRLCHPWCEPCEAFGMGRAGLGAAPADQLIPSSPSALWLLLAPTNLPADLCCLKSLPKSKRKQNKALGACRGEGKGLIFAPSEAANPPAVPHRHPYRCPGTDNSLSGNLLLFCAEGLPRSCAARVALFAVCCRQLRSPSCVCPRVSDSERIKSGSVALKPQLEFKSQSEPAAACFWSQGFKLLLPALASSIPSISALSTSGLEKGK